MMSVSLWGLLQKIHFPVHWRLLVEECIGNIGSSLDDLFRFCSFYDFFSFWIFWVIWSLQTSLLTLCIIGEFAKGGFVAVAVSVSDRWQVTCNRQLMTHDTWHVTCDIWHPTCNTCLWKKEKYNFVRFGPFWYWCYYPHMLRDPVSAVCRIFFMNCLFYK